TVLGDLAQATGPWAHTSWDEVLDHLPTPDGAQVVELTLGYRVSAGIMDVAGKLLPLIAPFVKAPIPVLHDDRPPRFVQADSGALPGTAASEAKALAAEPGSVAVIVGDALHDDVARALGDAGLEWGEASEDGLDHRVT